MKFSDFLNESVSNGQYKTEINIEKAAELYKEKCSNIDIEKPLWRGMRGKQTAFILKGDSGTRESISNLKIHNIILDELIDNRSHPKRSNCIIGITNSGKGYTEHFGPDRYAIYPYNDVVIGLCQNKDILERQYKGMPISYISEVIFEVTGINNPESMSELINKIFLAVDEGEFQTDDDEYLEQFGDIFDGLSRGQIEDKLDEIYGPDNYEFVKNNSSSLSGSKEVWIGGSCIAIKESQLDEFIKLVKSK